MPISNLDQAAKNQIPFSVWVSAARPRTLPLSLSSIVLGSLLAAAQGYFRLPVFLLAVLTTIFLQILSNLANDYGDSRHGADLGSRQGPARAVASGQVSLATMKRAVVLFSILSFLSGVLLLAAALGTRWDLWAWFLGLGIAAIAAAIFYTNGKRPYGYAGLGDISVLLFFGLAGVLGVFFLHRLDVRATLYQIMPALSCGLFATGVLNINNIRDIASDIEAGKYSLAVRLGPNSARVYHGILIVSGLALAVAHTLLVLPESWYSWFWVLAAPPFLWNVFQVSKRLDPPLLNPLLAQLAISTLIFSVLFGLSAVLGASSVGY